MARRSGKRSVHRVVLGAPRQPRHRGRLRGAGAGSFARDGEKRSDGEARRHGGGLQSCDSLARDAAAVQKKRLLSNESSRFSILPLAESYLYNALMLPQVVGSVATSAGVRKPRISPAGTPRGAAVWTLRYALPAAMAANNAASALAVVPPL